MNPHTTSSAASINPAMTWKACGATIDGPHCRQGRVQSSAKTMAVTTSQRHNRARQRKRRRGDDREIDVKRPEIRLARGHQ